MQAARFTHSRQRLRGFEITLPHLHCMGITQIKDLQKRLRSESMMQASN